MKKTTKDNTNSVKEVAWYSPRMRRYAKKLGKKIVEPYRPIWPPVVAALLGLAAIALFALPFFNFTDLSRGSHTYSFFDLMLGYLGEDFGKPNPVLIFDLAILVLACLTPLFSGRADNKKLCLLSSVFFMAGIITLAISPSVEILRFGFTSAGQEEFIVDGVLKLAKDKPVSLSYILTLVYLFLVAFAPYVANYISLRRGYRHLTQNVDYGKKLHNY